VAEIGGEIRKVGRELAKRDAAMAQVAIDLQKPGAAVGHRDAGRARSGDGASPG
jgi:hypothetical protein